MMPWKKPAPPPPLPLEVLPPLPRPELRFALEEREPSLELDGGEDLESPPPESGPEFLLVGGC